MRKVIDIKNQKFGKLTVLERSKTKNKDGQIRWICLCDCGNTVEVDGCHLRRGSNRSCGCNREAIRLERISTHKKTKTRLFGVWSSMKTRCYNKNAVPFKNYGGRGITVCDEWKYSFQAFYDWAISNGYDENAPRGKCTIDRIDVNGNYEPSNCRWITAEEQVYNRRITKTCTIDGKEYPSIAAAARILNIPPSTLYGRFYKEEQTK